MIGAFVFAAAQAAVTPAPAPIVIVAAVRSEMSRDAAIGARRTGLLCLPAGSLLWAEAMPDPAALSDAIAAALHARGADAYVSDDVPVPASARSTVTIRATIENAHIDACVPQHGLYRLVGGRRRLKANGTVSVRWRIVRLPAEPAHPPVDRTTEVSIARGDGAAPLADWVRDAIVAEAGALAATL